MNNRQLEVQVQEYLFEDDGRIPNDLNLPLLLYPRVLYESEQQPSRCKELLTKNSWGGAWVDGVFSYHHYHSTSHEVLCMLSGRASIDFGGPEGETVEVQAGDVVVIPAGVGHRNGGSSGDSSVVGPTRGGRSPMICVPARRANARRYWRTSAMFLYQRPIPCSERTDRCSDTGRKR